MLSLCVQNPKPPPVLQRSTLLCIDDLCPNCPFRVSPSLELSCLQELQQQALHTPSDLLFASQDYVTSSLACITHSSETPLTLRAKQGADVFKLVFSLRRFSFRISVCIINVFFLEISRKTRPQSDLKDHKS